MPIYEVEDPKTGQVLELEGESPPTEHELEQLFSQFSVDNTPEGNALDAVIEPLQAILGGAVTETAAGLAGAGNLMYSHDSGEATKAIEDIRQRAPDFSPETKAGQKGLQTVGDLLSYLNMPIAGLAGLGQLVTGQGVEAAAATVNDIRGRGVGEVAGDAVMEHTNSPILATAAEMTPDAFAAILGSKAVKSGADSVLKKIPNGKSKPFIDDAGRFRSDFKKALESEGVTLESIFPEDIARLPANIKPKKAAKEIIKRKLKAGDTDGFLATKKLDETGQVVDDVIARDAIAQGYLPGDIQYFKTASDATKQKMSQMVKIRRQIKDNTGKAMEVQPTNIIGDSAMSRIEFIRGRANEARKGLDQLAKNTLDGVPIDVKRVATKFAEELKGLKVGVVDGELNFDGSLISKDRAAKRVIKDALDLMNEPGGATALRAHELKKQLDKMINYRRSASQLTPSGEAFVKSIRRELNDAIRDTSDDYARLNDDLSSALEAIEDFEDAMGSKFSIFDENAGAKAGNRLRKMLTRYGISDDQLAAINQLDDVAEDLGGQFTDDIKALTQFNRTLEDRFGSVRRGSFDQVIEKTLDRAARGKEGVREAVIDKATEYAKKKILNQNDYEALRTLGQLVKVKPTATQSRSGLPVTTQ